MLDRRAFMAGALCLPATLGATLGRPAAARAATGYPPVPAAALQAMIDTAAADARRRHGARLAVVLGIVNPRGNGQLLFSGGEGLANPDGRALVLDGGTPFEIGSIAKVFTASLHYAQHGPFEGALGQWLAPRPMSGSIAAIPLADLARYRSGLAQDNHGAPYPPGTMRAFAPLFAYLQGAAPANPPGRCYSYSNLGWSLLAMAGHDAARGTAEAFAERYDTALSAFCGGLGMNATGIFRPALRRRLPQGYRRTWQALPRAADYAPTGPAGVGSGGIVSTGADMLAFLRDAMGFGDGGVESRAHAYLQGQAFAAPACGGGRAPRTAYGWILHDVQDPSQARSGPLTLVTKDGGVAGFSAWMGFLAWQGTGAPSPFGVFALSNGPLAPALGLEAMRRILAA